MKALIDIQIKAFATNDVTYSYSGNGYPGNAFGDIKVFQYQALPPLSFSYFLKFTF